MARARGNYRLFTDQERAALRELLAEGLTHAQIALKLGCKKQRIADWIRAHRDQASPAPRRRSPDPKPDQPAAGSEFIRPPSRAQLMGGR
jgi:transposase-like protein